LIKLDAGNKIEVRKMLNLLSHFRASTVILAFIIIAPSLGAAQTPPAATPAPQQTSPDAAPAQQPAPRPSLEREFFKNLLRDQRAIWTSPLHMHGERKWWAGALGISTAALIATDEHTAARLGDNPTRLSLSKNVSRIGVGFVAGGLAGGIYVVGRAADNPKARETGILAGEALINGIIVSQALKAITQRKRPLDQPGEAHFFNGGGAFPSGHSITAWSVATVLAHEYDNLPVQISAYTLASLVSVSRFTGRRHFLSDVLVGSAIGYGIGRYVYRAHHDPALDVNASRSAKSKSRLLPAITPLYSRADHEYGLSLAWGF
jgi:membrane-associated phospholipid phosphatase